MAIFPTTNHSISSTAEPIENIGTATTESGYNYAYMINKTVWYNVTLVVPIYYDSDHSQVDAILDFYETNKLNENIEFQCKGYNYIGKFLSAPVDEQQDGFNLYTVTCQFFAQRLGRI